MKLSPINNTTQAIFGTTNKKEKAPKNQLESFVEKITSKKVENPFSKGAKAIASTRKKHEDYKNLRMLEKNFSPEAEALYEKGKQIAKIAHSPELETWHIYMALLIEVKNFLAKMDEGTAQIETETRFKSPAAIQDGIYEGCGALQVDEYREKIAKVIDDHIKIMQKNFVKRDQEKYGQRNFGTPSLSAKSINEVVDVWDNTAEVAQTNTFYDSYWLVTAVYSQDDALRKEVTNFQLDLKQAIMTNSSALKEKNHIQFYDNKSDVIWQNLAQGNNVLILNSADNKKSYQYLINSFANLIKKPGQKYGNIDPQKVRIINLNEKADFIFMDNLARKLKTDKSKKDETIIIMGDLSTLPQRTEGLFPANTMQLVGSSTKENPNGPNIKFIFTMTPENYHVITADDNPLKDLLVSFSQQSLPILNATEAREYLSNESGVRFIEGKVEKKVAPEAILKAIEITSSKNGNYPEKTIDFIGTVAKYFINDKEITPKHIDKYLEETKHLSEATDSEERSIIFDTGKNLFDIKGMPMTQADAKTIVRQIKNGTIGTRGYIIQHSHGSAYGGGRRHSAEAIAGEAQIPMIVINAKDFALKDIDALSQSADLSELKIKKLISMAKAQAEANKLNTVMLYIENFDNFASNPLYGISSIYEQKAFSQLLAEMDSIRKEGKVNLVVMGSMNMPETLDENVAKPYKFLNQVVVYQPQDSEQRREILDYYIKKNNIQIAGETSEQKEVILNNISESTKGFTVVDLMYLLDNAKIISQEREKEAIDGADFIESFLQTTSGRTNTAEISEPRKRIVTSHEAGHALTLQLMYEIAKKQEIPWHLPEKVDFITLDPRGDYGGAMYFKDSENEEYSFEKVMSNIVCDYGGHSAENVIYNMQGSWGITADMEMAAHTAELAVTRMGMGAKTGVRHTKSNELLSERQKELIDEDMSNIMRTAKYISDSIITEYKDFILEFTDKYYSKVATGECIIPREEFISMLNSWREKQTPEKKKKLEKLENDILVEIKKCKKGE